MYYSMHEILIDTIQKKLVSFKEETGMEFFDAVPRFYEYLPETVLSFVPFTEEQITDGNSFKLVYDALLAVVNDRANRRNVIVWKRIDSYFEDSFNRCLWLKRKDTTNESYMIMENFIDEDKLRDIITKNPHKCWNPLLLCNNVEGIIPCIFQPSLKLREKYPFIIQKYSYNKTLIWADIDVSLLKKEHTIYINEDDIGKFYYGLYHPYIWGLIQSRQRNKLIHEMSS